MGKLYSCFVLRDEEGNLLDEHICYCQSEGSYLQMRKEEVLESYGHLKIVAYFAGTDRATYLHHLIHQRVLVYRDLYDRYQKKLDRLMEENAPIYDLENTRVLMDACLDTLSTNIGRATQRYLTLCNSEDRDIGTLDELAYSFHDWYKATRA